MNPKPNPKPNFNPNTKPICLILNPSPTCTEYSVSNIPIALFTVRAREYNNT